MRFTTTFFASTLISSLAVSAYFEARDDSKIDDLLAQIRSEDDYDDDYFLDYHEYKRDDKYDIRPYQIHDKSSNALNALVWDMKSLSNNGKLDMAKFDENQAAWALKLAEIVQEAEGKLSGPYNMDLAIAYHKHHFKDLESASKLRSSIKQANTNDFGIDHIDEIMRLYIEMYKLHYFNGSVNTKLPDIESRIATIELDFATLEKIVKGSNALPRAVKDFYSIYAAEVKASLNQAKSQVAISKANDEILQAREFGFWE